MIRPFFAFSTDEASGGGGLVSESVLDLEAGLGSEAFEEAPEIDEASGADDFEEGGSGEEPADDELAADDAEEDLGEEIGEADEDLGETGVSDWDRQPEAGTAYEAEAASTPQEDEQWSMNPRQQAYHEAQMLGRDSEWAENRAFDIYEERQAITNLRANASLHVPVLAQQFEQSGLPAGAAAPYYENLLKLTKQGFRHAAQDPQAQRVALANALGEYVLREHLAGRPVTEQRASDRPREEPKRLVTPTTGSSHGSHFNLSRLSRQDQRFISQWQSSHNGGKPPTSKQLAAMEAEGLIG